MLCQPFQGGAFSRCGREHFQQTVCRADQCDMSLGPRQQRFAQRFKLMAAFQTDGKAFERRLLQFADDIVCQYNGQMDRFPVKDKFRRHLPADNRSIGVGMAVYARFLRRTQQIGGFFHCEADFGNAFSCLRADDLSAVIGYVKQTPVGDRQEAACLFHTV